MSLFLISLFLVSSFSFLSANILDSRNLTNNIIYFFLSAFANVILTFEILSLFSKISVKGVLAGNILLFSAILILWIIKGRPILKPEFRKIFSRLKNALLQDRILLILSAGFVIMIISAIFLAYVMPANDAASYFYHVVRCLFWIDNGNFNHFNVSDARMLCFPINSEILYTWVLLFLKRDVFLSFFSIAAFIVYIVSLLGILSRIAVSLRAGLWVIFTVSSFTAVIAYLSSNETNIMIAALVLASIYLLIDNMQKHSFAAVYMSALSMAVAIGVKSSALFLLPAVMLWFITAGFRYEGKKVFKDLALFGLFLILNFLIFSSYNYILNFINYGNFFSVSSLNYSHQNQAGIRGFLFNLINYALSMFNFPEYDKIFVCSDFIFESKKYLFKLFSSAVLTGRYASDKGFGIISPHRSGFGLSGILVFLPCLIFSLFRIFFVQNKKEFILNSFSIIFLAAFLLMSCSLVYMSFNIRFIVTFALVAAPVIYHSYNKNLSLYKLITALIVMFSFLYIPFNITGKNVMPVLQALGQGNSIEKIRDNVSCLGGPFKNEYSFPNVYCTIRDYIKKFPNKDKFLYFSHEGDALFFIKELVFDGYKIDVDLIENGSYIDLSRYSYVITMENRQVSNLFHNINQAKDGVYRADGVFCVYNEAFGNFVLNPSRQKPCVSICRFEDGFFAKRKFVLFDTLEFSETFNGINNVYKYYVYKNMNKQEI